MIELRAELLEQLCLIASVERPNDTLLYKHLQAAARRLRELELADGIQEKTALQNEADAIKQAEIAKRRQEIEAPLDVDAATAEDLNDL